MEFFEEIAGEVIVGLIVAVIGIIWKNRKKLTFWKSAVPGGVKLPWWKTFKTPLIVAVSLLTAAVLLLVCFPQTRIIFFPPNKPNNDKSTPVDAPVNGQPEEPVQYADTQVSFYAGGGSAFADYVELNSPLYIDEDGGVLYVWDSGAVRELRPMRGDSYEIGGYRLDAFHAWAGELYAVTAPWGELCVDEDDEKHTDYKFTILRIRGGDIPGRGAASNVTDMAVTPFNAGRDMIAMPFTDFALSADGSMFWVARQDAGIGSGTVSLYRIPYSVKEDRFPSEKLEWFADLQFNVTDNNRPHMAFDDKGNLYISAPEDHCIFRFDFEHNAQAFDIRFGDHQDERYQDGETPRFLKPTSIAVNGKYLYVYDSGAVRRVSLENGECVTLAGRILRDGENPLSVPNGPEEKVSGAEAVLPCGDYPGLTVLPDGTVLLCNAASGVIYQISERNAS